MVSVSPSACSFASILRAPHSVRTATDANSRMSSDVMTRPATTSRFTSSNHSSVVQMTRRSSARPR